MTGEINLLGQVMAIGGVKEKILAAKRNNIKHVFVPLENKNDLVDANDVTKDIDIIFVSHADQVLKKVLIDN